MWQAIDKPVITLGAYLIYANEVNANEYIDLYMVSS